MVIMVGTATAPRANCTCTPVCGIARVPPAGPMSARAENGDLTGTVRFSTWAALTTVDECSGAVLRLSAIGVSGGAVTPLSSHAAPARITDAKKKDRAARGIIWLGLRIWKSLPDLSSESGQVAYQSWRFIA